MTPPSAKAVEERRLDLIRKIGTVSVLGAAVIGVIAMLGWLLGVDILKSLVPGVITMKANTALAFILTGIGLYLLRSPAASRLAIGLGAVACSLVFLLAAIVLSQYVFGYDAGVDQLLFTEPEGVVGTVYPGRMALNTCVCFMAVSFGGLIVRSRIGLSLSFLIGALVTTAGALALVGYLTGVTSLYGIDGATQMAVPTATGFVLLGIALTTAHPEQGAIRLFASEGPGGMLVRWVLPLGLLGLVTLAGLRLAGEEAGLFGTQVGVWLMVAGTAAFLVPLVWKMARMLDVSAAVGAALAHDKEAILNSAGEGIFRVDAEGRVTFVNPAAARMLGWGAEEILGKQVHELSHHSHADGTPYPARDCPIYTTHDGGAIRRRDDEVFWRADGSSFEVEYTSAPVRDGDDVVGATVVFSDISRRRAMERELESKREELELSNLALAEFASVAAHDLSSPLATISMYAELICDGYGEALDDAGRDSITRIIRAVERSQAMVAGLLALSNAGSGELVMKRTDLATVVEDVRLVLGHAIEQKGARIEVEALPVVDCDPDQVGQVFQNLISNAIKFSNASSPRVRISARTLNGESRIEVADNGIGIPPDKRTEVFGAFKRLHGVSEFAGSGIGLATCKRVVERHGGEIHIENGIDGGSSFVFTLPNSPDHEEGTSPDQRESPAATGDVPVAPPMR